MSIQKTITPIDNSVYLERPLSTEAEIDKVIESSKKSFQSWKNTSIEDRITIINKFIDNLIALKPEVSKEICWQIGRPISQCGNELRGFEERSRHMVKIAKDSLQNIPATNTIVPALLAGNTMVLKHSSQTPRCAELIAQALENTGLPEGVFQFVHTDHQACEKIISDPRIAHVVFTGSVKGGQEVKRYIGTRFINVGLELGGKDPAYVRSDADINHAIENLVDGAMFNSGQSCCGIERIYVDQSIYKDFIDGFKNLTEQYKLGDPSKEDTNLGPVVRLSAANFIRSQMAEAEQQGAKRLIDESKFSISKEDNCYVAPQVMIDVDHSMRFMMEETFGPAVGIMPVKDHNEAKSLMNDSPYGLTASIWTKDLDFAKDFGKDIETGTFFMNRCDYLDPALAWTGVKDTGVGCSLSVLAFDQLTRPQSFHMRSLK